MTSSADQRTAELQEYLRVLRARKLGIAVVTVAVVAVTMAFTLRQTPVFEGRAQVWVKPQVDPSSTVPLLAQRPNLETERVLVQSAVVAGQVQRDLHLTAGLESLRRNLHVEVVTDTEVLVVKYDDPKPATAARIANAFAHAYVRFRGEQGAAQVRSAAAAVEDQIKQVRSSLSDVDGKLKGTNDPAVQADLRSERDSLTARLGVLEQRLIDLQSNGGVKESAAQIVERASVPTSPVSPNKVRNGILALLVGLGLGIASAFLRERLDDRVKSRHEIEHRLGAPILAAIPRVPGWRPADDAQLVMRSDPQSPVAEAYRTLATNVQYVASQEPLKVVMVTSATGGDGKTTTSANLAVALAEAGRRVILVSADLRRPRLHQFFGVANQIGLSELFDGELEVPHGVVVPGVRDLRLVNAGRVRPDPTSLLGSQGAAEVMQQLRGFADFVVLDTPPVLAVADASILAPMADGAVFVVNAASSSRSAMEQARAQLENVGARIVGAVYNNFDPGSSTVYPYYDGHYRRAYGIQRGAANGNGARQGRRSRAEPFAR